MTVAFSSNPGQTIILSAHTLDGYGDRVDGYVPMVDSVYFPDGSAASGYPTNMSKVSAGFYKHGLTLPSGSSALGTYTASVKWVDPVTGNLKWEIYLIHVALPFGNSTVTPL